MNEMNSYHGELAASIEALFEGTSTPEQAEYVTRMVSQDPEAARIYWEYVELHAELRRIHHGKPAPPVGESAASQATASVVPLAGEPESPGHPLIDGGFSGTFGMATLFLGATFCLGLAVLVGWLGLRKDAIPAAPSTPIAWITAMSDCEWSDAEAKDRRIPGAPLAADECIRLESGSVEVTYANGVAVSLTGPAAYRIVDPTRGFLQDGFAIARVPNRAIGFTIDTPAGKIIDCGTEFGVTVDKDKETGVVTADMHVIDGAVDIDLPGVSEAERRRQRFKAGEAMRMSSLNERTGDPAAFDPRKLPGLRLWLNADAGVLRGPDDRVTEVIDLVGHSNATAENPEQPAAESRPRWHSGMINDRPTLVFEGREYIQLPSKSDLDFQEESLSIFVVGNASGGTQYFLSSRAEGEHKDPRGFRFTSSPKGGLRYQAAGVTVAQPCDMTQHAVFSVIHDRRTPGDNTVTLFRNGRQLGPVVKVANSDISNAFPLTIGANLEAINKYPTATQNYLRGDLGEILIFDRVLTPSQRAMIEGYLIRKYGLDRDASQTEGPSSSPPRREPASRTTP